MAASRSGGNQSGCALGSTTKPASAHPRDYNAVYGDNWHERYVSDHEAFIRGHFRHFAYGDVCKTCHRKYERPLPAAELSNLGLLLTCDDLVRSTYVSFSDDHLYAGEASTCWEQISSGVFRVRPETGILNHVMNLNAVVVDGEVEQVETPVRPEMLKVREWFRLPLLPLTYPEVALDQVKEVLCGAFPRDRDSAGVRHDDDGVSGETEAGSDWSQPLGFGEKLPDDDAGHEEFEEIVVSDDESGIGGCVAAFEVLDVGDSGGSGFVEDGDRTVGVVVPQTTVKEVVGWPVNHAGVTDDGGDGSGRLSANCDWMSREVPGSEISESAFPPGWLTPGTHRDTVALFAAQSGPLADILGLETAPPVATLRLGLSKGDLAVKSLVVVGREIVRVVVARATCLLGCDTKGYNEYVQSIVSVDNLRESYALFSGRLDPGDQLIISTDQLVLAIIGHVALMRPSAATRSVCRLVKGAAGVVTRVRDTRRFLERGGDYRAFISGVMTKADTSTYASYGLQVLRAVYCLQVYGDPIRVNKVCTVIVGTTLHEKFFGGSVNYFSSKGLEHEVLALCTAVAARSFYQPVKLAAMVRAKYSR